MDGLSLVSIEIQQILKGMLTHFSITFSITPTHLYIFVNESFVAIKKVHVMAYPGGWGDGDYNNKCLHVHVDIKQSNKPKQQ